MYFLVCFSRMFLEGKMSNVGEHPFGIVIRAGFFLDGNHLGKTGDSVGQDGCWGGCKSGLT